MWTPANNLEQERLDKLNHLVENGVAPYPNRVKCTHSSQEAIRAFEAVETEDHQTPEPVEVTVCGRIVRQNLKGKVYFAHIEDGAGRVQLFVRIDSVGEETYAMIKDVLDMGDFVQAAGTMMRTRAGEASVLVTDLVVLSKALSPLPVIKERVTEDGQVERYGTFSDVEERYRQRYADLAVNPDTRAVFRARALTVRALRTFLDGEGFLEVETPILQPIYGGAAARPFTTHHNQLHQDLFLRISFELYLKRLLVGMYDAVYEIGRDFRNEGVSFKHNPEFTQLEFYKAYTDYHGMMDLAERLVAFAAEQVTGSTTISFQGNTINLAPPWKRITLRDAIRECSGIDYMDYPDADSLRAEMRAKGLEASSSATWGKLVDGLLGDTVEPTLIQPTFITDYPRDISPLAKTVPGDPKHVERFEIFVGGMEMGNAFTELNDPLDQEARFIEMGRLYSDEDDEATPIDEDYLRSMRYGMPPAGGLGMGVDRLVMLLTDRSTIREVLLFPHLRERD
ncbi:MAG TPA: lysine--tRNA ligase [Aggregatilinea sp.]|uniref:lysine--tRNA ligase n=1 Tax=Aggregatilinea sp. TaxID=2806333 RepID=UPI002C5FCE39|nr:lysine--tRNA ligase [Aggregatilinea sp.]HML20781.1 lysine--tRNA ligase [Aggregatilinea sp.]